MEQSVIVGIITFCLGVIFGHRLTLWRDKRKEFNEIAQPIRETLLKEREIRSPIASGIGAIDADRLEFAMPFWRRCGFRKAWESYQNSKKETYQDSVGQSFYKTPENIALHIDNVLRYTKRQ
ncbi:MAG: hypothetical protein K1X48_02490 [Burkholderiaceae bacterium]|nr:hypothetical protein [Burkholderiaceae bacterium]